MSLRAREVRVFHSWSTMAFYHHYVVCKKFCHTSSGKPEMAREPPSLSPTRTRTERAQLLPRHSGRGRARNGRALGEPAAFPMPPEMGPGLPCWCGNRQPPEGDGQRSGHTSRLSSAGGGAPRAAHHPLCHPGHGDRTIVRQYGWGACSPWAGMPNAIAPGRLWRAPWRTRLAR
jgi:hypothetical protein